MHSRRSILGRISPERFCEDISSDFKRSQDLCICDRQKATPTEKETSRIIKLTEKQLMSQIPANASHICERIRLRVSKISTVNYLIKYNTTKKNESYFGTSNHFSYRFNGQLESRSSYHGSKVILSVVVDYQSDGDVYEMKSFSRLDPYERFVDCQKKAPWVDRSTCVCS